MAMDANRRRRYLVKRKLQYRYALMLLLFTGASALVAGYTVFLTGWTLFGAKLAQIYPQGRLHTILVSINFALLRNIVIILPVIFFIALYYSHKIAGPLYRMEEVLKAVGKGHLGFRVKFRKGDELKEMEIALNEMIAWLEQVRTQTNEKARCFMESCDRLHDTLSKIKDLPPDLRQKIAEMRKRRDELFL